MFDIAILTHLQHLRHIVQYIYAIVFKRIFWNNPTAVTAWIKHECSTKNLVKIGKIIVVLRCIISQNPKVLGDWVYVSKSKKEQSRRRMSMRMSKNSFGALLADLSKVFDCLSHKLLLAKLHDQHFGIKAYSWFLNKQMTENKLCR